MEESLLQALKFAISKGESLESAMESLYYAGYEKKDIEDAARIILQERSQSQTNSSPIKSQTINPVPPSPPAKPLMQNQNKEAIQKVSSYGNSLPQKNTAPVNKEENTSTYYQRQNVKPNTDWVLLIMIFILLLLISGLIATILFKPQLINFFNQFFS